MTQSLKSRPILLKTLKVINVSLCCVVFISYIASGLVITLESELEIEGPLSFDLDGLMLLNPRWITVDGEKVEFDFGADSKKLSIDIRSLKGGTTTIFINDPHLIDSTESFVFVFSLRISDLRFSKSLKVDRTRFAIVEQTATFKNNMVYRALHVSPRLASQLSYYIKVDEEENCTRVEVEYQKTQQIFYLSIKHEAAVKMDRVIFCFMCDGSEIFSSTKLAAISSSCISAELGSYSLRHQMAYMMRLNFKTFKIVDSTLKYAINCLDNDDWVIVGKTTGFIDTSSAPIIVQIIPLRCGNLPLPWISVDSSVASLVSIPSNGTFVSVSQ